MPNLRLLFSPPREAIVTVATLTWDCSTVSCTTTNNLLTPIGQAYLGPRLHVSAATCNTSDSESIDICQFVQASIFFAIFGIVTCCVNVFLLVMSGPTSSAFCSGISGLLVQYITTHTARCSLKLPLINPYFGIHIILAHNVHRFKSHWDHHPA